MRYELRWGVPNRVTTDVVCVVQVLGDSAEITVGRGARPRREERFNVKVGGLLTIGGAVWRLISVHAVGELLEGSPPGAAGQLAAVIEQEVGP